MIGDSASPPSSVAWGLVPLALPNVLPQVLPDVLPDVPPQGRALPGTGLPIGLTGSGGTSSTADTQSSASPNESVDQPFVSQSQPEPTRIDSAPAPVRPMLPLSPSDSNAARATPQTVQPAATTVQSPQSFSTAPAPTAAATPNGDGGGTNPDPTVAEETAPGSGQIVAAASPSADIDAVKPRPGGGCGGAGTPGLPPIGPATPPGGLPTMSPEGSTPATPTTPPIGTIPPGGGGVCTQSLSASDPLFVLNWDDGLVAAPGVSEFDSPGQTVELRAQVYGSTVQSYSWDYSQAPQIGCTSGSSTYKFKFVWNTYTPGAGGLPYSTNIITVTETMTDNSTKTMTLTFKVLAGSNTCMSAGSSATWPAVLPPDKPLEAQDVVASDSATRPYAVSQESGVVYVAHSLPAYNPGMPALGLTYSSIAAERRPIFVGRYELDPSAVVPNTVSARLQFNGSWGSSKYYDTVGASFNPGDILQISLQADGTTLAWIPTGPTSPKGF